MSTGFWSNVDGVHGRRLATKNRRERLQKRRLENRRPLLVEALEERRLLSGLSLSVSSNSDVVPVSYEYVAPTSYAYAGPNDVNLKNQTAASNVPAVASEKTITPPAPLPQHASASVAGDGCVVFLGEAGNANQVVFSVDGQGRLQHNLGGQFGFASDLDLDSGTAGVQSHEVAEIGQLTYCDLDATADDAVTIGEGTLDLGRGSLADASGFKISAGTITVSGSLRAGDIDLQARLVDNSGELSCSGAMGGRIRISASELLNAGRIVAEGTDGAGGEVSITLGQRLMQTESGLIRASGVGGSGGRVTILAGQAAVDGTVMGGVFLSGTIRADGSGAGATGGTISVSGGQLDLYGAVLQADGDAGGGRIGVGQTFQPDPSQAGKPGVLCATGVTVNPTTVLSADALWAGQGGQVMVWSHGETACVGRLTARGGVAGGDGGSAEVSGLTGLDWQGQVDVTAPAGRAGSVLLDPKNITVSGAAFNELIDPHPAAGNQFGATVLPLSTGNVVITSPNDDFSATNAGAVYLFNGSTGALISTLRGSTASDQIGSGGVTALNNGNYVVRSSSWDNGTATDAGAVTWGSGTTGITGVVSSGNSLVGSTSSDQIGSGGVTALSNGNYVVNSYYWDNGTATDAGAVTWGSGTTGIAGVLSSSNSFVGSKSSDQVGYSGVAALSNGNYVVRSPYWDNGTTTNVGAVTWGRGTTGITGVVSSDNSLVGSTSSDSVGLEGVVALSNGNYVVRSWDWDNGTATNAGAVTWGSGTTGITGVVSSSNSLVGSKSSDQVGYVVALSNGNYVVSSLSWDNGTATDAGAVTWGSGTTGITGVVSSSNSLVGSKNSDQVSGVVALSNGNYVVGSYLWDNGTATDAGAVTWGSGTTGITGVVSSSNSLVGSKSSDQVGYSGVTALSNGNYLVSSPNWDNGTAANAGAVTWGNGTNGITGIVSSSNSLVGSTSSDQIGSGGVVALSNGNCVVRSPYWDNGTATDVGAVTWCSGTTAKIGVVSSSNSLVGSTSNDRVGYLGVAALSNGNYVVRSLYWDNGTATDAGAVTWGSGTTGITGVVSSSNSLVGAASYDEVGLDGVTALSNGNYVVCSTPWDNGTLTGAGAVTWGSGTTGIAGVISSSNSLVGSKSNDYVGGGGVTTLSSGSYVVGSPNWDNGTATDAGAVTWGSGTTSITGVISSSNSLVGLTSSSGLSTVVTDDVNGTFFARFVSEGGNTPTGGTYGGRVRVGSQSGVLLGSLAFGYQADRSMMLASLVGGTLNTGSAVALQANSDITVSSPITASNPSGNGGNLTLQAGRSLLLNANLTTDDGNLTLTANDTVANGVVDAYRDSGAAAITMASGTSLNVGAGTLTVSLRNSSDKTYNARGVTTLQNVTAASTVLNDGTILLNGTLTGPATVNSPAVLGGTGTISGAVVCAGGTIASGTGAGILNTGSVTFQDNSSFNVEIGGTTPGNGTGYHDQLNVTGSVTIGANVALNLSAVGGFVPSSGQSFTVLNNDDTSDGCGGTFAGLPNGAVITNFLGSGLSAAIRYSGGDGNDVVISIDASPDLVATSFDATPDQVLDGQTSVNFTIKNQGGMAAGAFDVRVVLSDDSAVGNADDATITTVSIAGLAAGATSQQTVALSLPKNALYAWAQRDDVLGQGIGYQSTSADFVGLIIDPAGAVTESNESNNLNQGQGIDKDDITYFPWDVNGSGAVTPTDAGFVLNRLGQTVPPADSKADLNGNGAVTPTDAGAVINRIGYFRNASVLTNGFGTENGSNLRGASGGAAKPSAPVASPSARSRSARLRPSDLSPTSLPPSEVWRLPLPAIVTEANVGFRSAKATDFRGAKGDYVTAIACTMLPAADPASRTIWLDDDAAGRGWFMDRTPAQEEEFRVATPPGRSAPTGGPAADRIDFLTAVMHEMGHLLGKADVVDASDDLMASQLSPGIRRTKAASVLNVRDALLAGALNW